MKLILTRHGETIETKNGILQGHMPGQLTVKGIDQAKSLASKLKDERIDNIFSSDLSRSADTAREIVKYHDGISIIFDQRLRERCFGNFEGKNKKDIGFYDQNKQGKFINPPNGETIEEVYNRANKFYKDIFPKYLNGTVLVVSHDDIGKCLISAITGNHIDQIESMKKASITILNIMGDQSEIIIFNNTDHLD